MRVSDDCPSALHRSRDTGVAAVWVQASPLPPLFFHRLTQADGRLAFLAESCIRDARGNLCPSKPVLHSRFLFFEG